MSLSPKVSAEINETLLTRCSCVFFWRG